LSDIGQLTSVPPPTSRTWSASTGAQDRRQFPAQQAHEDAAVSRGGGG
jgi:hypothetical protein